MVSGILLTAGVALGWFPIQFGHIQLAIPTFLFTIFIQAFVMFYFIGVARLVENVWNALNSEANLSELFDSPPSDLEPYKKKVARFVHEAQLSKAAMLIGFFRQWHYLGKSHILLGDLKGLFGISRDAM